MIFLTGEINAQDTSDVLFIGNSYTYYNNLPQMVANMATSFGDHINYDSNTPGGATLSNHAGNAMTYTKINSNVWDYVVLQAQSQEPSFPDSQVDTQTIPYAIQIADSVYDHNFCTDVMMFMTWGRENGDPQWVPISTYDGMQSRLRSAYMRMADSVQGSVSPVGVAWKHIRDNHPTIQLYAGDGSHPSMEGSYLAACTFYASIFRKSPIGSSYISTLDPTVAGYLQEAASMVVLDSLDQWNLRPISEHTQAEFSFIVNEGTVTFENLSTKAQTYSWDFGDGQTSTDEVPTVTYNSNGLFTVTFIAESECDADTISYDLTIEGLSINELNNSGLKVKNLGDGMYQIDTEEQLEIISVYDFAGNKVIESNNSKFDLSAFANGVYLTTVKTSNGFKQVKLIR